MRDEKREEKPGRDNAASKAFDKYYGQMKGVLELFEAGLPPENRHNLQNVRIMMFDALYQLRSSVDEYIKNIK